MTSKEKIKTLEKIFEIWNGKPEHSAICLRYVNLILSDTSGESIKQVEDFLKENKQ